MPLSTLIAAVQSHAQTRAALALTDTCTVQRASRASDGEGGSTVTYPAHLSNVPCSIGAPGGDDEALIGEGVRSVVSYIVRVAVGTDVGADDRIVIGTETYEVVAALDRTYEAVLRLAVKEVE
jgi:hypothetical protein